MCIQVKDHSRVMCEQLQQLRLQTGLVDLDIVCEDHHINVHKVVMAACSRFFKDQLCKQNIQGPVILRLEDFGLELKGDAVSYIIEFVYRGEVNIPGEKLTEVCQAAHTLGVVGLDHLPVPAETQRPSLLTKEHLQIADESELRGDLNNIYSSFSGVTSSPQNSVGKFSMDINNMNPFFMNNNPMQNEDIILLQTTEDQSRNIQADQDIIPISFGDTGSSVVSHYQQDKINLIVSESGQVQGEQFRIMPEILPDDGTFHEETIDSCLSLFPSSSAEPQDLSPGKGQEGGGKSGQVSGVRHSLASLQPAAVHSSEVGMNISGNQTSLQALFEAAEAVVSKSVGTSASLVCSPTATVNTSSSTCMPRVRGKHPSTMSQGKLRVINQGIHSENIQSPSRQEAGRRRSAQVLTAAQPAQEEGEESEAEDTDTLGQDEEPSHQPWTHPVESGETAVPPVSSSQWNINNQLRPAEIPVSGMSGKTPSIPWNTPVTLESPLVTVTTVTGARDTPPNVSVSWTQPQTSACPSPGQKTGASQPAPSTASSLQQTVRAELSQSVELEPRQDPSLDSLSPQQAGPSWKPTFGSDDIMLARKSGIPLALQNKAIRSGVPIGPFQNKRKRKSRCSQDGSKMKKKAVVSGGKKGDLEVRKDLIISQEDLSTENVFQNDESCASTSNIVSKTKEESINDPSQVVSVSSPIGGVHIKTVKKLNSDAVVAELELGVITDLPGSNLADSPKLYQYSCVNCSMMFPSAAQLKRHTQLAHSKDETLFCQVCPEKCSGKENLKLHLYKTHGIGEIFRCEECNYESPVKAVFLKHLSEHIPQEAIKKQCPKCDKVFKTKAGLKQHLKQHFDESLYSCLVCEFKTPQKLNLVKHTASKHGQDVEGRPLFENFACEFCDFKCIASVSTLFDPIIMHLLMN